MMKIELSKKGLPCIWEWGGAYSNTGNSCIICNEIGDAKRPLYVKQRGHLACGEHALIPIKIGDLSIAVEQHRGDFEIHVYKIIAINMEQEQAETELVCSFSEGEWDKDPAPELEAAIEAAKSKAMVYHCRRPYYIAV